MRRRTAYALLACLPVLTVIAGSIEHADAHISAPTMSPPACLGGNGWSSTLTVSASDAALNPVAHITTKDGPGDRPAPFSMFLSTTNDWMDVTVYVTWSDGFRQPASGATAFHLTRPSGCTTTTTAAATTTTVPEVTTSTPSTTSPPPPVSAPSTEPPVTSVPGVPDSPPPSTGSSTRLTPSTIAKPIYLPPTGASDLEVVLIAVGVFLVLVGLVLLTARRNHEVES